MGRRKWDNEDYTDDIRFFFLLTWCVLRRYHDRFCAFFPTSFRFKRRKNLGQEFGDWARIGAWGLRTEKGKATYLYEGREYKCCIRRR